MSTPKLKVTNYNCTTEQRMSIEKAVGYYMRCQMLREAINGMSKHVAIISTRLAAPERYKLAMQILEEFAYDKQREYAHQYMLRHVAYLEEEFLKYAHMFLWHAGLHNEMDSAVTAAGRSFKQWNILLEDAWKEFSERQTIHA